MGRLGGDSLSFQRAGDSKKTPFIVAGTRLGGPGLGLVGSVHSPGFVCSSAPPCPAIVP